jgi:hypothetical protein
VAGQGRLPMEVILFSGGLSDEQGSDGSQGSPCGHGDGAMRERGQKI